MKFDKNRKIPSPFAKGICPECSSEVFAKCGEIKFWHWSHYPDAPPCFQKEETIWHRQWKEKFPEHCQEVYVEHHGKRHRADVIFDGIIYEFQSNNLRTEEMREREEFWCKTGRSFIWILKAPDACFESRPYCVEPKPWKAYTWVNPWGGLRHTLCPIIIDKLDGWFIICSYIEWDEKKLLTRAQIVAQWKKDDGCIIDFKEEAKLAAEQYRKEPQARLDR